eukprot:CAMPEP_0119143242 /NCGR_PEP_ID=MMETSP1310-20130426/34012_1 /TAXON_ID=464262 /ORGANISM="Genus nov. species nov., Strain RCC2339" /LENGTH=64 /DNA_ID=CAMNT_0007134857 /DNA_START=76 /DNA_END=266 /DNA_ORIENTATION=+
MAAGNFSGALQLTGLDDFITPSQECIKPLGMKKSDHKRGDIEVESDGTLVEVDAKGDRSKLEKA